MEQIYTKRKLIKRRSSQICQFVHFLRIEYNSWDEKYSGQCILCGIWPFFRLLFLFFFFLRDIFSANYCPWDYVRWDFKRTWFYSFPDQVKTGTSTANSGFGEQSDGAPVPSYPAPALTGTARAKSTKTIYPVSLYRWRGTSSIYTPCRKSRGVFTLFFFPHPRIYLYCLIIFNNIRLYSIRRKIRNKIIYLLLYICTY